MELPTASATVAVTVCVVCDSGTVKVTDHVPPATTAVRVSPSTVTEIVRPAASEVPEIVGVVVFATPQTHPRCSVQEASYLRSGPASH